MWAQLGLVPSAKTISKARITNKTAAQRLENGDAGETLKIVTIYLNLSRERNQKLLLLLNVCH